MTPIPLNAAARGSVDALSALFSHYYNPNDPAARKHFRTSHPEFAELPGQRLRRAMRRQQAALQILNGMRGNAEQASYALQRYTRDHSAALQWADLQHAKLQAEKIYAELEARRLQWGLGAFDNSNPYTALEAGGDIPAAIETLFTTDQASRYPTFSVAPRQGRPSSSTPTALPPSPAQLASPPPGRYFAVTPR